MFDSSKDILYIVISFCIIWVTIFLCWVFYYVVKILKNTNQIVDEFRLRLQALLEAINGIKEKMDIVSFGMNSILGGVSGAVKKVIKKKVKKVVSDTTDTLESSAKEAVEKAVEAASQKIKKVYKNIKKK